MKKIAILINRLSDGGSERIASTISLNLPNEYQQHLLITMPERINYGHHCDIVRLNYEQSNRPFRKIKNLFKKLRLIHQIKKFKKNNYITSTISFGHSYNIYNILSKSNDKVILTIHTIPSLHKTFKRFFARKFVKYLYKYADIIIVVSKYIKYDLNTNFNILSNKIKVINNLFNIDNIRSTALEPIDEKYYDLFDKEVIILVGRISPEKGQEHLIKAFSTIHKSLPDSILIFLGFTTDGSYKNKLHDLIRSLGLKGKVKFIDFQKNPYKFIKRSKLTVVSSLYEGFSNIIVESMCCKIPVISVDCKSGPREIISPRSDIFSKANNIEYCEYGILTPEIIKDHDNSFQIECLGNAILSLMKNNNLYKKYSDMGKFRAMDFDTNMIINKYDNIIE